MSRFLVRPRNVQTYRAITIHADPPFPRDVRLAIAAATGMKKLHGNDYSLRLIDEISGKDLPEDEPVPLHHTLQYWRIKMHRQNKSKACIILQDTGKQSQPVHVQNE